MKKVDLEKLKEIQKENNASFWKDDEVEYLKELKKAGIKPRTIFNQKIFPDRSYPAIRGKMSNL